LFVAADKTLCSFAIFVVHLCAVVYTFAGFVLVFAIQFHPADTPSVTTPYSNPFWENDWTSRGDVVAVEVEGLSSTAAAVTAGASSSA
jgi:hypothetical protein